MRQLWPACLAAATVVLAGCVGEPAPAAEPRPTGAPVAEFDDETGAIHGRVVDDAVLPVPAARIAIVGTRHLTTSEGDGAFAFSKIPPGSYALVVERLGYESAARRVDVLAGQATEVQVILAHVPVETPHYRVHTFDGFWTCWVTAVVGSPLCNGVIGDDSYYRTYNVEAGYWAILTEMKWSPTSPVTSPKEARIYIHARIPEEVSSTQFGPKYGESPIRWLLTPGDKGVGGKGHLDANATILQPQAVPGGAVGVNTVTNPIVYQQRFNLWLATFHYMTVPEGYSSIPDT